MDRPPCLTVQLAKLFFGGACMCLWPLLPPYVSILLSLLNRLAGAQRPHSSSPASYRRWIFVYLPTSYNGFVFKRIRRAGVRGELAPCRNGNLHPEVKQRRINCRGWRNAAPSATKSPTQSSGFSICWRKRVIRNNTVGCQQEAMDDL